MIVNSLRQIAPETVHDHGASPLEVAVREQRRSRVIAMSEEERDAFLGGEHRFVQVRHEDAVHNKPRRTAAGHGELV